jgi:putative thioredoxin
MDWIFDATEDDFEQTVVAASHEHPILVDISADWCAPCRVLSPVLEQVIAEFNGDVHLAMVDADENMRIAGRHQVRGFPTVIAYSRGGEIGRFSSAQTHSYVRAFVERVLREHQG